MHTEGAESFSSEQGKTLKTGDQLDSLEINYFKSVMSKDDLLRNYINFNICIILSLVIV